MNKFNVIEFLKNVDAPDIFNFIKFPATKDSCSVLFFGFQNRGGVLSIFSKLDSNQVCDSATIYLTASLEKLCACQEKLSWVSGKCSKGLSKFFCVVKNYEKEVDISETLYHKIESPINSYFKAIEDYFEREIVRETFNIKFKDGDFIHIEYDTNCYTAIFKRYEGFNLCCHVLLDNEEVVENRWFNANGYFIRPATFSEKQQFLTKLLKEGKQWDSNTKTMDDVSTPKFKTLDYFLVKISNDRNLWMLHQFAFEKDGLIYDVGGWSYDMNDKNIDIIAYNDKTKHLLGTSDEVQEKEGDV